MKDFYCHIQMLAVLVDFLYLCIFQTNFTYTIVTNVKPECTLQNDPILRPGACIRSINKFDITHEEQGSVIDILCNLQESSVVLDLSPPGDFEGGGDQGGDRSVYSFQGPPSSLESYTSPPSLGPSTLPDGFGNGTDEGLRQFNEQDKWSKQIHAAGGISPEGLPEFFPYQNPTNGEVRQVDRPNGEWLEQSCVPKRLNTEGPSGLLPNQYTLNRERRFDGVEEDEWLKQTHASNGINSGPSDVIPSHYPVGGGDGHYLMNGDTQYSDDQQFIQSPVDAKTNSVNYGINPTTKYHQEHYDIYPDYAPTNGLNLHDTQGELFTDPFTTSGRNPTADYRGPRPVIPSDAPTNVYSQFFHDCNLINRENPAIRYSEGPNHSVPTRAPTNEVQSTTNGFGQFLGNHTAETPGVKYPEGLNRYIPTDSATGGADTAPNFSGPNLNGYRNDITADTSHQSALYFHNDRVIYNGKYSRDISHLPSDVVHEERQDPNTEVKLFPPKSCTRNEISVHCEVGAYEEAALFNGNTDLLPPITSPSKDLQGSFGDLSKNAKDTAQRGQSKKIPVEGEVTNGGQFQELSKAIPSRQTSHHQDRTIKTESNIKTEPKNGDCDVEIFPCADGRQNETVNNSHKDKDTKEVDVKERDVRSERRNTGLKSQSLSTEPPDFLQKAGHSKSKTGKFASDKTPPVGKQSNGCITGKLSLEQSTAAAIEPPSFVGDEKQSMVSTRSESSASVSSNSNAKVRGSPTYINSIPQGLQKKRNRTQSSSSSSSSTSSKTSSKKKSFLSRLLSTGKSKNVPSAVEMTIQKEDGMGSVSSAMSKSVSKMSNIPKKMSDTPGEMNANASDGMSDISGRRSNVSVDASIASSMMSNGTMNSGVIQNGGSSGNDSAYDTDESFLRDRAVQQPGSIKWTTPPKTVHLVKNKQGRFGFKCKVKEVS